MVLSACAFQGYEAQTIEVEEVQHALLSRTLDDPEVRAFAMPEPPGVSGPSVSSVPSAPSVSQADWTLDALVRAAVHLRPEIAEARSELAMFDAALVTAGRRQNPTFGVDQEHHSQKSEHSSSPWSWGVMFEVPLTWPSRRAARLDEAAQRLRAARLEASAVVWQLRAEVRSALVSLYAAHRRLALARRQQAFQAEYLAVLERRLLLGDTTRFEVSRARLEFDSARLALVRSEGELAMGLSALAARVGVPSADVEGRQIDFSALRASLDAPDRAFVQEAGLHNRLDIRHSLALYAVAEAQLRLQIAAQYPDLTISPGVFWDQGDLIWQLGGGVVVPLFDLHEGPIAQARARRHHAADSFTTLQARVLADLDMALVAHEAALAAWRTAQQHVQDGQGRIDDLELQIAAGRADRLALVQAQGELLRLQAVLIDAETDVMNKFGHVEDAVQRPLDAPDASTASEGDPLPDGDRVPPDLFGVPNPFEDRPDVKSPDS